MAEKTQSCNLFHVRFGVLHARTVVFALQAKNIPATRFTIVVSHVSHYRIAFFLPFLSIRPAVPLSIRPAPVSSRAVCCRAEKTARTGARLCSVTFDIPQVSSCCLLGRARRAHWMPCGDSRKHFWLTPHTMTSYSSSQLTLAADAPLRALSPPAACGAHPANPLTASAPRPAAAVPRKFLRDSPCVFAFSMIAPFLTIRSASFACVIREYRKAQGRIQRRGATMRNRCSTMWHAVRCDASVRTGARGTGLLGGRIQPARNRMLRSTAVRIPATEPPFVYCHRSKSNCPVGTATSYSANQTGRLPNALLPKRAMSCLFP